MVAGRRQLTVGRGRLRCRVPRQRLIHDQRGRDGSARRRL